MTPADVYYHSTRERIALEVPYIELLSLERLLFSSTRQTGTYDDLLALFDDPFFNGDPFEEFRRLVARYQAMALRTPTRTERMLEHSTRILGSYRGLRDSIIIMAYQLEDIRPKGDAVDLVTNTINSVLKWAGIRNPMLVVSSGLVVATLLSKRISALSATSKLSRNVIQDVSVIDVSSDITEYISSRVSSVVERAASVSSDAATEPLSILRPFYRKNEESLTLSRMTTQSVSSIRRDGLMSITISQAIMDSGSYYDKAALRGLKILNSFPTG